MTEQLNNSYLITKLWFFTGALYNCTIAFSCRGQNSKAENGWGISGDGDSHSESLCFRLLVSKMKGFLKK